MFYIPVYFIPTHIVILYNTFVINTLLVFCAARGTSVIIKRKLCDRVRGMGEEERSCLKETLTF